MMAEERTILGQWDSEDLAAGERALSTATRVASQANCAAAAHDNDVVAAQFEALRVSRDQRIAAAAAARAVRTAAASELQGLLAETTAGAPAATANSNSN